MYELLFARNVTFKLSSSLVMLHLNFLLFSNATLKLPFLVRASISMSSENFYVPVHLFIYIIIIIVLAVVFIVFLPHPLMHSTAENFLFCLVNLKLVTEEDFF